MKPTLKLVILSALLFSLSPTSESLAASHSKARDLVNSLGCKGCHMVEGIGGNLGPDLKGIGNRLSSKRLLSQLESPKKENPNTIMPSYKTLPQLDRDSLVRFLKSL